ncbi:DNA mismatch repair endonuclease MutL [Acetilactobacillus jinshanensis]|uniref:DNA mismatch repair protein MutL n=1 Tax=Acetilactobacillus jinshanensis TaxID=1720083 RepID=A0A4P6ZLJ9_9LACO|nr:DNA mismatch repair endonuclease MutL [Acetilactobacillus jinshanensis]QBP18741.1 DNA mismatch repair endonuclease MutL [Acetilactobacillus jinshanensis]URL61613.1 DNA mismatch repair endonuclease MutL [uncultured bacterium]
MAKIHKLSPTLSNQISAGEVVERPSSVVKELVENSIDAHSRDIDVAVKGSGLDQIKVTDDGIGIEPDDVKTAFMRHATSKIHNRRDLFQVDTLGFRGEALPSIASVADVDLKTSTGGEGTEIRINGGKLIGIQPAEARRGTIITVNDLFFNTPARLKYMKSPATELSRITDVIDRLALGHPKIAFSLIHNHHEMLRTAGRGNLQQVIGSIYGINKVKKMLAVKAHNNDFKLWGYVSLPELTRASRNYITIILNGRYIKNRAIADAVIKGYGSKLMVRRYPIAVINIQMDPILVDPNVHPSKTTVRVSKEPSLCHLITTMIMNRLSHQNLIPNVMHREYSVQPEQPHYDVHQINLDVNQASVHYHKQPGNNEINHNVANDTSVKPIIIKSKADLKSERVRSLISKYRKDPIGKPFGKETPKSMNVNYVHRSESPSLLQTKSAERFPKLRYIGQMHGSYLLCEASDGLYIVDQHAAQERVNYEYFRQKIGQVSNDEQDLLVPIVLSYSNSDVLKIKQHLDVLQSVGIKLEPFGADSFIVHQHPTWFRPGQERSTIEEMIDWVLKNGKISIAKFRAKTAIMMSCKRAIKANHYLNRDQAISLLNHLSQAEDPFNCPHGRPTLVHFSNYDMQKMFKRVQDPHHSGLWKQYQWKK